MNTHGRADSALPEVVRARRKELRLTQTDLADLSGCSARFVQQLEEGKATVQLDKVLGVLTALGLQLQIRRGAPGIYSEVD